MATEQTAAEKTAAPKKKFTAAQIASRRKALRTQRIAIITACILVLLVLIGLIIGIVLYQDQPTDDGRILPNVYAAGIELVGSKEEARTALLQQTSKLTETDMVVELPDGTLILSPEDTGISLDVDAVVEAAYRYGRTGTDKENQQVRKNAETNPHTIALLPYMTLDLDYIQSEIEKFSSSYGSKLTQPTSFITGSRPEYDPEQPDAPVTHQILTVTMGTPDYALDAGDLYDRVLDGYSLNQLTISYDAPTLTEPDPLSAQKLFSTYCSAPQDAAIVSTKYHQVEPEVYGYGFDIAAVQQLIDEADYGQTLQITLNFLMPAVTAKNLTEGLFVDTLAQYTSTNPSGNNDSRNTNLALSCAAINGIVLQPGEEFSFNDTVGRPTAEKGYKKAPFYRGDELVEELGGGITQTASVLYYCALMSNLDILERHNNSYTINYIPLGLDAYVDWGAEDLRIRNSTASPIRIVAQASGSSVTVQLLGVQDSESYVEISTEELKKNWPDTIEQVVDKDNVYGYVDGQVKQSGLVGYEIQTLLNLYSAQTGELVYSMPIDISVYNKRDKIIIRLEKEPEPEPPTEPTVPTDPSVPSEPTVPTDPTEPSAPI